MASMNPPPVMPTTLDFMIVPPGIYSDVPPPPTGNSLGPAYRGQVPALFVVRQEWPSPESRPQLTTQTPLHHVAEDVCAREFGLVAPTGRFTEAGPDGRVNGQQWKGHRVDIRELLVNLAHFNMASNFMLSALLDIIGQGIEHVTFVMRDHITIRGDPAATWGNATGPSRDTRLRPGQELVACELPMSNRGDSIRRGMYKTRFVATLALYDTPKH